MELFFYIIPFFIAGVAVFIAATVVQRARARSRAWDGLVAEARCLRVHTSVRGGERTSTLHHYLLEFTTADGRTVRFEEVGASRLIVEGDIVPVHYDPEDPEKATADRPSPVANTLGAVALLAFCGLIVAFGGVFIWVASSVAG